MPSDVTKHLFSDSDTILVRRWHENQITRRVVTY